MKIAFDYHSLRHIHATMLIENEADIKMSKKNLVIKEYKPRLILTLATQTR